MPISASRESGRSMPTYLDHNHQPMLVPGRSTTTEHSRAPLSTNTPAPFAASGSTSVVDSMPSASYPTPRTHLETTPAPVAYAESLPSPATGCPQRAPHVTGPEPCGRSSNCLSASQHLFGVALDSRNLLEDRFSSGRRRQPKDFPRVEVPFWAGSRKTASGFLCRISH